MIARLLNSVFDLVHHPLRVASVNAFHNLLGSQVQADIAEVYFLSRGRLHVELVVNTAMQDGFSMNSRRCGASAINEASHRIACSGCKRCPMNATRLSVRGASRRLSR